MQKNLRIVISCKESVLKNKIWINKWLNLGFPYFFKTLFTFWPNSKLFSILSIPRGNPSKVKSIIHCLHPSSPLTLFQNPSPVVSHSPQHSPQLLGAFYVPPAPSVLFRADPLSQEVILQRFKSITQHQRLNSILKASCPLSGCWQIDGIRSWRYLPGNGKASELKKIKDMRSKQVRWTGFASSALPDLKIVCDNSYRLMRVFYLPAKQQCGWSAVASADVSVTRLNT